MIKSHRKEKSLWKKLCLLKKELEEQKIFIIEGMEIVIIHHIDLAQKRKKANLYQKDLLNK